MSLSPSALLESRANRELARLRQTVRALELIAATARHSGLPADVSLRLVNHVLDELEPFKARVRTLERMRASTAAGRDSRWFRDGDQL